SSLYTLTTAPPPLSASGQVAASTQVFAAASRSSMASRALVSGLLWSLPPLPPGPDPTCVPCVEGRQRATPHSSSFPPTKAPLQTLHIDVWGPARVRGQGHERYFLLVVDDYSRYTTVFPLRSQDRGGEFSSDLLRAFCRSEGICQTFTLLASPQKNGIAERRIGMVMDVARTSMIHAGAPHFLWPFAVQYAVHQINLQPRVSLPETTPTLRWTGKVGDASAFRVWGSRAFVRDTTTDKLSSRAVPCVFLGFPLDALGWQFYHPTSRRVLSSHDVTFDESGPAPSGVSQVDPAEPLEVAVDSGAARATEPAGVETGGAESGGAESGRAEPGGAEPGRAEPERAMSGGALGVQLRREPLSLQQLRKWYSRRCRGASGAPGGPTGAAGGAAAGAAGATGSAAGAGAAGGNTGGAAGAGGATGASGGAAGAGAAGGAAGAGAAGGATGGAAGAGGAGAAGGAAGAAGPGDPRAEGTSSVSAVSGGAVRPRPYYVPLLQQVLGSPPSPGPPPPSLSPLPVPSQSQLPPASPLPGPSPYSGPTRGLTEHREPESRPVSPVSRSTSPVRSRVPPPSPPASSLPDGPDPESDSLRAASPTVTRFLATAVTDPLFESSAASALVA
ncbi:unnamed protein product, partial [Closterium sp. NIES-53]